MKTGVAQPKYVVLVMHHILVALQNGLGLLYHYMIGSLVPGSPHTLMRNQGNRKPGAWALETKTSTYLEMLG